MAYRLIDWLRNTLTAKTTTIDGTEQVWIDDAGTSKKATVKDALRYGGGSPRNTTIGNATVTQTTDGALYLEVAGQTAGNARGAGAFDWQAVRTNAANVASGANSIAMGRDAKSSGASGVALGNASIAQGSDAFAVMGGGAIGAFSVAIGQQAYAPANGSVALGGGYCATTNIGQFACSGNVTYWGAQGIAQCNIQGLAVGTTDATPTVLRTDKELVTYRMVIPATRAITFTGLVTAMCNVSTTSNFVKSWEIKGCITRDTNNTTRIVGTPTITVLAQDTDGTQTPSTWAITSITADDTNESLAITVTGQAGQTIRWQATLLYGQVGF